MTSVIRSTMQKGFCEMNVFIYSNDLFDNLIASTRKKLLQKFAQNPVEHGEDLKRIKYSRNTTDLGDMGFEVAIK
jgi:hypothetical protein